MFGGLIVLILVTRKPRQKIIEKYVICVRFKTCFAIKKKHIPS